MKQIIYIFCLLVLLSCKSNKNGGTFNENYKIFKKESVSELTLIHGVNKNDTVLFIVEQKIFNDCMKKSDYISKENLKEITFYNIDKDTINFLFGTKDVNNQLLINTGIGKPGQKKKSIWSYRKFPFLIENCSSFK